MQQPSLYVPQGAWPPNPFVTSVPSYPAPPIPVTKGAKVKDPNGPAPMDYRMEPVSTSFVPQQPFPTRMWS